MHKVILCRWYTNERPYVKHGWSVMWRAQDLVRPSGKTFMPLQGAHHMGGSVLYILKCRWFHVTFQWIIVRRYISLPMNMFYSWQIKL